MANVDFASQARQNQWPFRCPTEFRSGRTSERGREPPHPDSDHLNEAIVVQTREGVDRIRYRADGDREHPGLHLSQQIAPGGGDYPWFYAGHPSYQRLEFVGDAVLGLAVSHYLYERYPDIGSGDLTTLRCANVSNEKLSRVAVRLGLYRFLRRNSPDLDKAVGEFTDIVTREEEEDDGRISFGGRILKAHTVLADMVESIAAAVYWDCDSNLKLVWKIFSKILTPIITLETKKEQPVAALDMLCQKRGKALEYRSSSLGFLGSLRTVSVFVDGIVMGTGTARQVEIAKLNAAKAFWCGVC